MQKKDGILDRGLSSVRDVHDRADEKPNVLGIREKIWVYSSVEIEFKKGHTIPKHEFFGLEAQYLMRARALARQQGGQLVEHPRGWKPSRTVPGGAAATGGSG